MQLEHEHKLVLILPHYETADNLRNILFDTAEDAIKNMKMKILLW